MEWERYSRQLLYSQLAAFLVVAGAIVFLTPAETSSIYLYELVGALAASIITVFGLRRMKTLTSE